MLSSNARFDEQGLAAIIRDLERHELMFGGDANNDMGGGVPQSANDQTVAQDGIGNDLSGLASIAYVDAAIAGATPPAGSISVSTNVTDTTDTAALTITGTFYAQNWTLYEKHPRFNAKWLLGAQIGASTGTVTGASAANLFLWWNKTTQVYEPFTMYSATTVGLVNCYDPAATDANGKMTSCAAGTANSVFGRASNTAGVPAAIVAGTNDTILGQRAGALTWAKVAKAEMADAAAVSVIGRSANSSGVTADIAASADGMILGRFSSALSFVRDLILGTTSNAGSITIANATSATAIVISPTLVGAAGKVLSVREIDVCDAGVAKKMLVLASAPY